MYILHMHIYRYLYIRMYKHSTWNSKASSSGVSFFACNILLHTAAHCNTLLCGWFDLFFAPSQSKDQHQLLFHSHYVSFEPLSRTRKTSVHSHIFVLACACACVHAQHMYAHVYKHKAIHSHFLECVEGVDDEAINPPAQ